MLLSRRNKCGLWQIFAEGPEEFPILRYPTKRKHEHSRVLRKLSHQCCLATFALNSYLFTRLFWIETCGVFILISGVICTCSLESNYTILHDSNNSNYVPSVIEKLFGIVECTDNDRNILKLNFCLLFAKYYIYCHEMKCKLQIENLKVFSLEGENASLFEHYHFV